MIAIKDESGRNGKVVAAFAVHNGQSMVSIASNGMMVRSPVADIRVCGRSAQGVRLVRLSDGAKLVSVSIADAEEVPENPLNGVAPADEPATAETPADTETPNGGDNTPEPDASPEGATGGSDE